MKAVSCPECGADVLTAEMGRQAVLFCPECWGVLPSEGAVKAPVSPAGARKSPAQAKLPGLDRGRQQRVLRESEAALVERIRRALNGCGFGVQRVGQYRANLGGTDKGVADLLVRHRDWPAGVCQQQEVKLPGAVVPAHQQALADAGVTVIVHDPEEALAAARACSAHLVVVS